MFGFGLAFGRADRAEKEPGFGSLRATAGFGMVWMVGLRLMAVSRRTWAADLDAGAELR